MAHIQDPSSPVVAVMVPFPLHSHLNQLLQLSQIISSYNNYNIQVHYVASSVHIAQVKSRATIPNPNNITFHAFPTSSESADDFAVHSLPSLSASIALRQAVNSILESLSATARRLVVIHDPIVSTAVRDARASFPDAEFYTHSCISAFAAVAAAGLKTTRDDQEIPASEGVVDDPGLRDFLARQYKCLRTMKISGHLRNTCRAIESEFLDMLEEKARDVDESVKFWAIGPLETVTVFKNRATNYASDHGKRVGQCLEWLDKQEPKSVLYVSFGTTTFMEDEQIRELAIGLEQSGTKFIWVLRDADKANVFDEGEVRRPRLPVGFEARVEENGMGMVVRKWAPQLEILGHPSTGGFMSHCGWNSCLESMSLGVPIAAWPMAGDQPMNSALVTNVLKSGIGIREWAKREELVSSSVIAEAVEMLMESKEGDETRKRVEDLGSELRRSAEKGGVSHLELDSFVAHITRI